jgi:hypothetical protein
MLKMWRREGAGANSIDRPPRLMESSLDRLRLPLTALMQWFREARLRATIIGGVAASLRGKPRLTKDIDVVVLDASPERLLQSGAPFHFVPRVSDALGSPRALGIPDGKLDPPREVHRNEQKE